MWSAPSTRAGEQWQYAQHTNTNLTLDEEDDRRLPPDTARRGRPRGRGEEGSVREASLLPAVAHSHAPAVVDRALALLSEDPVDAVCRSTVLINRGELDLVGGGFALGEGGLLSLGEVTSGGARSTEPHGRPREVQQVQRVAVLGSEQRRRATLLQPSELEKAHNPGKTVADVRRPTRPAPASHTPARGCWAGSAAHAATRGRGCDDPAETGDRGVAARCT